MDRIEWIQADVPNHENYTTPQSATKSYFGCFCFYGVLCSVFPKLGFVRFSSERTWRNVEVCRSPERKR